MGERGWSVWAARTHVAAGAAHYDRDSVRSNNITYPRALRSIEARIVFRVFYFIFCWLFRFKAKIQ